MSRTTFVVLLVLVVAGLVALVVGFLTGDPPELPARPESPPEPGTGGGPMFPPLPGPGPADGPDEREGGHGARGAGEGRGEEEDAPKGKIRGVVLDEREMPVAGARVTVMEDEIQPGRQTVAIGDPPVVVTGPTDAEGRFEATVPADVDQSLGASAAGYASDGFVTAKAGDPPVTLRLRRVMSILGTVVDDVTGESVSAATLLLRRVTDVGDPESGPATGYRAEGGTFVLSPLAAGRYRLTVTVAGYDAWQGPDLVLSAEEPHARVEARVARTGVWGGVLLRLLAPDGTPVERVNRAILHQPESGFLAMTPLGAAAPVRLEAPRGRHVAQVQADGYLPAVRAVDVPGGGDTEVRITLREAGHVHVLVTDADGNPASGYRLGIYDAEGNAIEYDLRIRETNSESVGAEGVPEEEPEEPLQGTIGKNQLIPGGDVTLKNLPPGRYRLEALREGVPPAEQTFDVEARGTVEVRLSLR